jgi:hypothetical protein
VSIDEGKYFILRRPWSEEDGVTIPAGTAIWVTPDKERELREAGFIDEPVEAPGEAPSPPPPISSPPPEYDPEFFDVHGTGPELLTVRRLDRVELFLQTRGDIVQGGAPGRFGVGRSR